MQVLGRQGHAETLRLALLTSSVNWVVWFFIGIDEFRGEVLLLVVKLINSVHSADASRFHGLVHHLSWSGLYLD